MNKLSPETKLLIFERIDLIEEEYLDYALVCKEWFELVSAIRFRSLNSMFPLLRRYYSGESTLPSARQVSHLYTLASCAKRVDLRDIFKDLRLSVQYLPNGELQKAVSQIIVSVERVARAHPDQGILV